MVRLYVCQHRISAQYVHAHAREAEMFYRAAAAGTPVVTSSPLDLAGISSCWVPNGDDEGDVAKYIHRSVVCSLGCAAPCIPILRGSSQCVRTIDLRAALPG